MNQDDDDDDDDLDDVSDESDNSDDSDDGDDPDDSDASSDSDEGADPSAAETPSPSAINPVIAQYLKNKQNLANAQQQAATNNFLTDMARASASLSAGLAHSNQPVNNAPFNAMEASDQAPVTNLLNSQKAQALGLKNQSDLMANQQQLENQDPNSPQSAAAKKLVQTLYKNPDGTPKYSDADLENLSASDIQDSIYKPMELDEKIQENKETHELSSQILAQRFKDQQDAKTAAAQSKASYQVEKDLNSFRGNGGAQQASRDIENADKVINSFGGKLDSGQGVTRQDLAGVTEELGKLVNGGVSTETGTQALMPNDLATKYAQMKEFLSSNPTDSEATAFAQHNLAYIRAMRDSAQGTLNDFRRNILAGAKGQLSDSDYQDKMQRYGLDTDQNAGSGIHPSTVAAAKAALAQRQAQGGQNAVNQAMPNLQAPTSQPNEVPASLAAPQPPGFAFGGTIPSAPGFHQVYQPRTQRSPAHMIQAPKPAMPKAPHMVVPAGMKSFTAPAPQHFAEGGDVLNANARNHIAAKNFALPGGRYPIEDETHARNALARVSQNGTSAEKAEVRSKVHAKYPGIEQQHMAHGGTVQCYACGGPVHSYKQGGTVPGTPNVPYNSPANDTVTAKLTPKEEVLPLSVTQSKTPALMAYLHMKARGYK